MRADASKAHKSKLLREFELRRRIRATVEIAWAMAWKPHASQQQPLKPGSAKARLAGKADMGQVSTAVKQALSK